MSSHILGHSRAVTMSLESKETMNEHSHTKAFPSDDRESQFKKVIDECSHSKKFRGVGR
jgi:hypothetical protein